MADSPRAMRRSIFERELLPIWRNGLLTGITPDDLRAHCGAIVDRGAPATTIRVADVALILAVVVMTEATKLKFGPGCILHH
jgi:hypothetical protein